VTWLGLAAQAFAQYTCYTDPQGTTLCSSPDSVIHGTTNSVGSSVYRDDRGNLLDFHTDQTGKASVELPSGKTINWSQGVLGEKKYPFSNKPPLKAAPLAPPVLPGTGLPTTHNTIPGQP
jgi:hypothetical protein